MMTVLLLTLLIIIAGAAFAWYRIKTRGVATVLEETRRFIALQNSKDVMAFKATMRLVVKATKRLLSILDRVGDEQAQRLHERYHVWYRKQEGDRVAYRAAHPKPPPRPNPPRHSPRRPNPSAAQAISRLILLWIVFFVIFVILIFSFPLAFYTLGLLSVPIGVIAVIGWLIWNAL